MRPVREGPNTVRETTMVARKTDDYTNNNDARIFDPALRRHAPAAARYLFEQAESDKSYGSTFTNVEFGTECSHRGLSHGRECQIGLVTIPRRSDGSICDHVVSASSE